MDLHSPLTLTIITSSSTDLSSWSPLNLLYVVIVTLICRTWSYSSNNRKSRTASNKPTIRINSFKCKHLKIKPHRNEFEYEKRLDIYWLQFIIHLILVSHNLFKSSNLYWYCEVKKGICYRSINISELTFIKRPLCIGIYIFVLHLHRNSLNFICSTIIFIQNQTNVLTNFATAGDEKYLTLNNSVVLTKNYSKDSKKSLPIQFYCQQFTIRSNQFQISIIN